MISGILNPKLSFKERKKKINRFLNKLQISPKFRREMKIQLKGMYLKTGEVWDDAILKKNLNAVDRELVVSVSSFTGKLLALIERLDKLKTDRKVTGRRFSCYIHKTREKLLIEERFQVVNSGERVTAGIVIFKKWGKEGKPGGFRLVRRLSKRGYDYLDSGKYFMKRTGLRKRRHYFRGKKIKIKSSLNFLTQNFIGFYITNSEGIPFLPNNQY